MTMSHCRQLQSRETKNFFRVTFFQFLRPRSIIPPSEVVEGKWFPVRRVMSHFRPFVSLFLQSRRVPTHPDHRYRNSSVPLEYYRLNVVCFPTPEVKGVKFRRSKTTFFLASESWNSKELSRISHNLSTVLEIFQSISQDYRQELFEDDCIPDNSRIFQYL